MKSAEQLVGAAVLVFGLGISLGVYLIPEAGGYAQVGPRVFPAIVAAGLLGCGGLLLWQSVRGGFRHRTREDTEPFDRRAFAWLSGGIVAHLALIGTIGFIAASTLLFMAVARGLGSMRWRRDLVVAVVLAAALYVLFTRVLGLALGPQMFGF